MQEIIKMFSIILNECRQFELFQCFALMRTICMIHFKVIKVICFKVILRSNDLF